MCIDHIDCKFYQYSSLTHNLPRFGLLITRCYFFNLRPHRLHFKSVKCPVLHHQLSAIVLCRREKFPIYKSDVLLPIIQPASYGFSQRGVVALHQYTCIDVVVLTALYSSYCTIIPIPEEILMPFIEGYLVRREHRYTRLY